MDMSGRHNEIVVVVLSVSQFLTEPGQVMIVHEGDRTHGLLVLLPFNLNETVADHVADEFGPVRVPAFALELVELFQEGFLKRN